MRRSPPARSPAPEYSSSTTREAESTAAPVVLELPRTGHPELPRSTAEQNSDDLAIDSDIFEDPHSLLPKFTRIRVIGNNRTKIQLVGQLGVVKTATGLGGWHRVVLDIGGEEVRLQRNALSVVSRPTGDESDFSDDDVEDAHQETQQEVILPRERRRRAPAPSSADFVSDQRRISSRHAAVAGPRINLQCLNVGALKRYKQHYQLTDIGDSASREQMATAVGRHFMQQSVDEADTIESFVNAAYMFAQGHRHSVRDT